jgi:YNFM family putative membrane transporter
VQASAQSFVATSAKNGTSSAIGLYVTAFYIGGSAGVLLAGLTWERGGWIGVVSLVAAMLAFMATTVGLAWQRDRARS